MVKDDNEALRVILNRRSIRNYTGRPLDHASIERILEAGLSAPSAHDSRPWHVGVVRSEEKKNDLIRVLHTSYMGDMKRHGFSEETIRRKLERSYDIYSSADTIIVLFGKTDLPRNKLAGSFEQERIMVIQSVAAAATQMWIATESLGLSMCWFSAPLFCANAVLDFFGLGTKWQPLCLLTVGKAGEAPKAKKGFAMSEYVTFL